MEEEHQKTEDENFEGGDVTALERPVEILPSTEFVKVEKNLASVAFPSISTGVYGYPRSQAAEVSSKTIENFLSTDRQLKEVRLVFFQEQDAEVFLANQKFNESDQ